jgi:hypothetical protein
LRRLHHEARCEIQQSHAKIASGVGTPYGDGRGQGQSSICHSLGHCPAGDHPDNEALRVVGFERHPRRLRQMHLATHPPHPNVGVQQNHLAAFQSGAAPDCVKTPDAFLLYRIIFLL